MGMGLRFRDCISFLMELFLFILLSDQIFVCGGREGRAVAIETRCVLHGPTDHIRPYDIFFVILLPSYFATECLLSSLLYRNSIPIRLPSPPLAMHTRVFVPSQYRRFRR